MRYRVLVAHMWEKTNAFRVLVGQSEGKRPLRRPWCRWKDNIQADLKEIGRKGLD
jgi:hypothetical protein